MDNNFVDEKIKEIEDLKLEIEKKEKEREEIKSEVENKKKEKIVLEKQIEELEDKRKDKLNKLEKIKSIISGDETVIPDFDIKPEEVFKYIPTTPLDGIKEIEKSLEELRDVLNYENKKKTVKENEFLISINIRCGGDNLKYIIPQRPDYTFKNLLEDACEFFDRGDSKDYIFYDELNNIFPLHPPVREFLAKNPDFVLYLNEKGTNKKGQDREKHLGSESDKLMGFLNDFLRRNDPNLSHENVDKNDEDRRMLENRKIEKQRKENDILLLIEKTFGGKITFLIFYFIFLLVILLQVVKRNDISNRNKFYTAVKNEFETSAFTVSFLVQDFLYNSTQDSEYKVDLVLDEITDVRIFPDWFNDVFLKKLGFYSKKLEFIEKHKLIGKMRFMQIRSKDDADECITQNMRNITDNIDSNLVTNKTSNTNCYKETFVTDTENIKFDCKDILDSLDASNDYTSAEETEYPFMIKGYCKNDPLMTQEDFKSLNDPCSKSDEDAAYYNPFICELIKNGTEYKDLSKKNPTDDKENITERFIYSGDLNEYNENYAFYMDLDYDYVVKDQNTNKSINENRLRNFGKFLFKNWIDINTRIVMIGLNCYQTIEDQDSIFSINFYIEFSKTRAIKKKFEINFFTKYLDFENITVSSIFGSFSYFIFLFLYSSIHLFYNLRELIKEKMNIFYKQFTLFVINLCLNSLILSVLIFRIYTVFMEIQNLKPYKNTGFKEYFPVSYYRSGVQNFVKNLEIIMISLITLNTLNSFYFEFFARIFLTFKYAWKYLFAYLMIYFIIIIAYAASCNILFGSYIKYFSTLTQSIITMILLNYIEMEILNKMVYYYPFASRLIIFSYYFIFYFIVINIIFVIFLRAYEKVKRKEPVSLLKFKLIYDGLENFVKNLYQKYFPNLDKLL